MERSTARRVGFGVALLAVTGWSAQLHAQIPYNVTLNTPTGTPVAIPYVNVLGVLLEREVLPGGDQGPLTCSNRNGCIREVTFRFPNAPVPFTSGTLTVVAAGDIGFRQTEAHTDFISVLAGEGEAIRQNVNLGALLGTLFLDFATGCPLGEVRGLNPNGTPCGVNYHNVTGPLVNGGDADPTNGVNLFATEQLTLSQAQLATLIANDGTLSLTLFPNIGDGNTGVGRVKYMAVMLSYNAPEPSSLALIAVGGICLLGVYRRRRTVRNV